MNDPAPENIQGMKKSTHSVEWEINVSHLMIAIAVLYIISKFTGSGEGNLQDLARSGVGQEDKQGMNVGGPTG
jgi:hypothetical protein